MSNRTRPTTIAAAILALILGIGWTAREFAFARERAALLDSRTVTLDEVKMNKYTYEDQACGEVGVYLEGDTPASTKFVTGRFVLDAGKSPHPPHRHVEEEVMIVESGQGEILCDGKTTKVGPGSVMYTTPDAPHSIENTGSTPLVFYFVKWAGKAG